MSTAFEKEKKKYVWNLIAYSTVHSVLMFSPFMKLPQILQTIKPLYMEYSQFPS